MVRWWRTKSAPAESKPRPLWVRWTTRVVGWLFSGLMWLVLLVALFAAGMMVSSGMRNKVLDVAWDLATDTLPGNLIVADSDWADPGHLRLTDVVWRSSPASPDTLAHIVLLDLRLNLDGLRQRDIGVDSLDLVLAKLDVPAIESLMLASRPVQSDTLATMGKPAPTEKSAPAGSRSFLRPGAIPGLPSVAVARWRVELTAADITAELSLDDLLCTGALEARAGRQPAVVVDHLQLDLATSAGDPLARDPWAFSLQHLDLGLAVETLADGSAESGVVDTDRTDLRQLQLKDLVLRGGRASADTLAHVARLDLHLLPAGLQHRDVGIDSLDLVMPKLDVPAIERLLLAWVPALADSSADSASDTTEAAPLLRPGAIPGLPSVAIAHWRVALGEAVVTRDLSLDDLLCTGALEARAGRQAAAVVDHLQLELGTTPGDPLARYPWALSLQHLGLGLALPATADSSVVPGVVDTGRTDRRQLQLKDVVLRGGPASADTLAHIAALDLTLVLAGLQQRDVGVDSLDLVLPKLDVPAIERLVSAWVPAPTNTAAGTATDEAQPDSMKAPPFPRPGAIPGLPSVAIAHWRVALGEADITADLWLDDLLCTGALEARSGRQAAAVVDHLQLDLATTAFDSLARKPWALSLQHLGLGLNLETPTGSLTSPGVMVAVMDSLSLRFDAFGDAPEGQDANWRHVSGPVRLSNSARISRTGDRYEGIFLSDFVLPGAADFQALLPADFPYESFGRIAGRLQLKGNYAPPILGLAAELDLEQSEWLDRGQLAASIESDFRELINQRLGTTLVDLDTLDFSMRGAEVRASGKLGRESLDLTMQAVVADTQLARLVLPGAAVSLDLAAQVGGTVSRPNFKLELNGALESDQATVPSLSLRFDGGLDGGRLDLSMPAGLATPEADLDSLQVQLEVARDADSALAGSFAVAAWRGVDHLALGGQAWADSLGMGGLKKVQLDSLTVKGLGQDVRLQEAAVLEWGPGLWDIDLTPLVVVGGPGEVSVKGRSNTDGLDLASRVAVVLPEALLNILVPHEFWSADGGKDFSLRASADLQGTRAAPTLGGHLEARLVPHRDEPNLGLDLDFSLATGDSARLQASLAIVTADSTLLKGHVAVPGHLDPATGAWRHTPGQPAEVVVPEQTLGLAHLNRLLPSEVAVEGAVALALMAQVSLDTAATDGGVGEGSVEGYLRAPQLAVRLPNRSRLETQVDVKFSGTLADPVVGGRVTVKSGFFRLPELPRTLHPTTGTPFLWDLVDSNGVMSEVGQITNESSGNGAEMASAAPAFMPNLNLEILIPGNLRLHGYGLDVELAGDLKVGRAYDRNGLAQPQIHGTVHTLQGTLQFMNRVFTVERSEVRFTGSVPPDPELDLQLEVDVSGTLVRIMVSGTATNPVIKLSAVPEYEEQDIIAVLLFGRPLSELDNEERSGVQGKNSASQELRQNLTGLAMAFGTAGLQNKVSKTLGVDMVEVGSGSEGDNTLMVGKFINPKLMLKYHHSLEKSGTYFLTMEYALSRIFKVVTTYGQGEEDSGLELKWTRKY